MKQKPAILLFYRSFFMILLVSFALSSFGGNKIRSAQAQEPNWVTYITYEYGYELKYPSEIQPIEHVTTESQSNGVPSDLWFGESIHVISRIPALEDEFISRLWNSAESITINGADAFRTEKIIQSDIDDRVFVVIQYLIRGVGVDYVIGYEGSDAGSEEELTQRQVFENIVASFSLLPTFTYESPIQALAASADGFDFFVDPPNGGTRAPSYASYNANNGGLSDRWSPCYGKYMDQLQHTGEDWFRVVGTPIYAVANGRVIYIHPYTYPGNVIIVEHTLGNGWTNPWGGSIIYSVYAHVSAEVTQWSDVAKGQRLGTIIDYPDSGDHIHFEMRRYGDMTSILVCPANGASSWPGPGYTNTGVHPDTYGYTNPSAWIDGHRSDGSSCDATSIPSGYTKCAEEGSGNWCTFSGTKTVYYGVNSCFAVEQKSNGVECINENFGGDPLPGVHKACYIQPDSCSNPNPSSNEIVLFENNNYGGACKHLGIGEYPNPGSLGFANDSVSSIKVGGEVKGILCKDDNFSGGCEEFTSDDSNLSDNSIGDNQVSSAKVESRSTGYPVTLYTDANYSGGWCAITGEGWINICDGYNDIASSIRIQSGWSARVWEHSDRGGASRCFTSDVSNFSGMQFNENGSGNLDNAVSSFAAYHQSSCPSLTLDTPTLNSPGNGDTLNRTDNVNLSWNSVSGATQYYAEFWGGPGTNINSGWTSNTSWSLGSQWGGSYQWRVKAKNSSGTESNWSETRTLKIRPGTPTNLVATAVSASQINLSWGASSDGPGNIDGYLIYRNGELYSTAGNTETNISLTGHTCGTTYSFVVKAYKSLIESNPSNTASATTSACPVIPNTPSNFRVTGSTQTSITLAWDDVSNETGYKIYEWNGSTFVYLASVGANVTTFIENRGACGWDEFYEVSAYNGNGESAHANWIHGYTLPCTPSLSVPSNGSSNPYNYDLTFQWNASSGATEYLVEWWGGPYTTMQPCGWSSSTSCHIGTVAPDNTYYWHVKARNSAGESGWSSTWSFTIQKQGTGLDCGQVSYSGVILYEQKTCNKDIGGVTKIFSSPTGWIDIVSDFNDITSSIYVGNGWSVKVFEHPINAGGGSWRCINGSMWDLGIDYYTNGNTALIINDTISSVQVYNNTTCSDPPVGDTYEPDDTSVQAHWINSGLAQSHSIIPAADVDWIKFQINTTSAITLETTGITGSDTRMWLYDINLDEIEYDDDDGTDWYSFIDRICNVDALPAGTYYIKIDEFGNNNEIPNYQISLNIVSCVPTKPAQTTLISPKNNYVTNLASPTFTWNDVPFGDHYEISFANNAAFTQNTSSYPVNGTTYTSGDPLSDGKHYWRVRSFNANNEAGPWSITRAFTIDTTPPPVPVRTSPMNGASLRNTPVFRWTRTAGAVLYQFEYDNDADFSSPIYNVTTRTNSRRPPAMTSGTYYWHVRAQDAAGNWSDWSPTYTVNILAR